VKNLERLRRSVLGWGRKIELKKGLWCAPFDFYIFFLLLLFEPTSGTVINPGMALTPLKSSILNETRFELSSF
jgi:hypothetical protein